MRSKTAPLREVKTGELDGLAPGEFSAVVSVFGNKDSYGDVVMPGAFTDTLAAWKTSGDPIPIYWSHRMDDPDFNLGAVTTAAETDKGLQITGQLDLDNPKSAQVYRLMKGRRVTEFSFAYDVEEGSAGKSDTLGDYFELRKLKLYEVGPTPIGANDATELLGVKGAVGRLLADSKAGRVLSSKNEGTLRDARDAIDSVLASIGEEPKHHQVAQMASSTSQGTDEEPMGAKSREPDTSTVMDGLVTQLATLTLKGFPHDSPRNSGG